MNRDKPHCITSFFYFYLVASIHQLAGYELYTLSLSILSHNESLIGHMLCITNMRHQYLSYISPREFIDAHILLYTLGSSAEVGIFSALFTVSLSLSQHLCFLL